MEYPEESKAFIAAQQKLQDALQEISGIWGPRICEHGDFSDCETCDFDKTAPMENCLLSEFVVVASWTNMETGKNHVTWNTPPNQLMTHTNGLLFSALYE